MNNPRMKNGSRRRKLRAHIKSLGLPCALCGKPIDYDLPATHPWSYELDEIVPVSLGGSPFDINNVQPAHRYCNQLKGNGLNRKGAIAKLQALKKSKVEKKSYKEVHSREW